MKHKQKRFMFHFFKKSSEFSSASISPVLQVLYAGVLKSKNHKNLHVLNGSQNAKTQKR